MMILKEHNISVRLPQERAIDTGIVFVQNDKDVYKLNIRVFDGVYEIDYTEVEEATITFSKADGKVVQGDMQIEADQLTYVLGTNEIAVPGKLIASIQLLGANERLTTARFLFRVEKDLITPDAVKSTSEFPILQKLKKELEEIDVVDLRNDLEAHLAEFESHKAENANKAHGGYKGALLQINQTQSIPNSEATAISWTTIVYRNGGTFWSADAPTRLVVPEGVSRVRLIASVAWTDNPNGTRAARIYKNGANLNSPRVDAVMPAVSNPFSTGSSVLRVITPVINANPGDYFELYVMQTSGSSLNVVPTGGITHFAIEVIE